MKSVVNVKLRKNGLFSLGMVITQGVSDLEIQASSKVLSVWNVEDQPACV